jgi:hypothetical protein
MVRHCALSRTVVAKHERLCVAKFRRHRLPLDKHIQVAKLGLHIRETLVADRTFVGDSDMFVIALLMDAVTACHEDHWLGRCEHVLSANGTVAVGGSFDTLV